MREARVIQKRQRLDITRRKREVTASRRPLRVLLILESLPFGSD
ncbi:MAG: hypothetical protein QOD46_1442, partial [Actinomycetota bacterium]|nr:hypothetical protein [Actinomycetota bacterium]